MLMLIIVAVKILLKSGKEIKQAFGIANVISLSLFTTSMIIVVN